MTPRMDRDVNSFGKSRDEPWREKMPNAARTQRLLMVIACFVSKFARPVAVMARIHTEYDHYHLYAAETGRLIDLDIARLRNLSGNQVLQITELHIPRIRGKLLRGLETSSCRFAHSPVGTSKDHA